MRKSESIKYEQDRKRVSKLFYDVLSEKLKVREALVKFPKNCKDKTVIASWHALCHLEADEDLRSDDIMYKEVQDEYLEFIANTLSKGIALPENIIKSYYPFHKEALIPDTKTPKGIWNTLKKFLCC